MDPISLIAGLIIVFVLMVFFTGWPAVKAGLILLGIVLPINIAFARRNLIFDWHIALVMVISVGVTVGLIILLNTLSKSNPTLHTVMSWPGKTIW